MDAVGELVGRLNGTKKLRVWSVIITFFGDAIVPRGGSVSARTVRELLQRMGIEAGAVRTAFSRLTNDGWVVREKIGRSSFYHLSPTGLRPFAEATDRIYAPLPRITDTTSCWQLAFKQDSYPNPQLVRKESSEDRSKVQENEFVLEGRITQIPDWLKSMKCPSAHRDSYIALIRAFEPLIDCQLNQIDSLAVRCLLIHEWRRILFQFDKVEPEFWTADWPEADCHRFVCRLYQQLLPASEAWMASQATCPQGQMPQTNYPLASRFS